MTKKKKALIITVSIFAVIAIVIGSFNAAFAVIGNQKQYGNASGEEWNETDAFDIGKTKSINVGDKEFKTLILTDVHLKNHGTFAAWLGINYILDIASEIALNKLITKTAPDLILVLGDTVLTKRNDIEYQRFADFMDKFKIPWAPVFGNHDEEGRADINKLCDILLASEYCIFEYGPKDLHGAGNYVVNINRGDKTAYSYYMLYSGMVSVEVDGKMREDSINKKQIDWYKWNVNGINAANGLAVPNMAFFHIPLPQYADLNSFELGERGEDSYPQYIDYGFFDSFKNGGGTHVFVGHDHNNNFVADYEGVKLCYAQKSSFNCYFKSGMTGGTLLTLNKDNSVTEELVNF